MMRNATGRSDRVRSGFTLIELLVVIAIIALLVSLLMPSLNEAKKLARASLCLSNLRLAAMAITPYSLDNEGWIPPQLATLDSNEYDSADYDNVDGALRGVKRHTLITQWWTDIWDPVRNGDGFFGPYIGATRRSKKNLVGCPSIPDRPEIKQYTHRGTPTTYVIERGKGYGTNYQQVTDYKNTPEREILPMRLDDILRPVDLVYCCDTVGRSSHVYASLAGAEDAWDDWTADIPTPRHAGNFNMAFCDGHADSGTMHDRYVPQYFDNHE